MWFALGAPPLNKAFDSAMILVACQTLGRGSKPARGRFVEKLDPGRAEFFALPFAFSARLFLCAAFPIQKPEEQELVPTACL